MILYFWREEGEESYHSLIQGKRIVDSEDCEESREEEYHVSFPDQESVDPDVCIIFYISTWSMNS